MAKDFKPEPPKSLVDGAPMPQEDCESLADRITSGKMEINFTPEARVQMAKRGLTEEELKRQILEGLLSGVRKIMINPNDHPFWEVVEEAGKHVRNGATVFQKWTCAGCGARLTLEEPNTFHISGTCDVCPAVTNIEAQGCNYLLIKSFVRPHAEI